MLPEAAWAPAVSAGGAPFPPPHAGQFWNSLDVLSTGVSSQASLFMDGGTQCLLTLEI